MPDRLNPMNRIFYIDNFRIWLTLSVIFHHAAVSYGGIGDFWFKDPSADSLSRLLFFFFNAFNQAYFMSAFFFLAGYFTPASLDKKGLYAFAKDRFLRLGLPLIFYSLFLSNINDYQSTKWTWDYRPDHLWFVQALLMFSIIYAGIRIVREKLPGLKIPFLPLKFSRAKAFVLAFLALSLMTFLVRIFYPVGTSFFFYQLGHFTHYTVSFFAGIAAFYGRWFDSVTEFEGKVAKYLAFAVLMPLFFCLVFLGNFYADGVLAIEPILGGANWAALTYSLWESASMLALILFFSVFFKFYMNRKTFVTALCAENVYGMYIFHATFLIGCNIALQPLEVPGIVKFIIASIVTTVLSLVVTAIIRKLPFAKQFI